MPHHTVLHRSVLFRLVQYSTAVLLYCTVQYSSVAVLYSTLQHCRCTVQYITALSLYCSVAPYLPGCPTLRPGLRTALYSEQLTLYLHCTTPDCTVQWKLSDVLVLHCTVMHFTVEVEHCTCTALNCTALYCTVECKLNTVLVQCSSLHSVACT